MAAPAVAQAPVVGPEGDPTIQDDTIYSLAVDPADHPEETSVLLLDDGILVQEPDGTGSRTYRMVAQILSREAVDGWAEHTWGYDGDRESFRLNWIRVVDLDGNVISDEPIHQQVMDLPVPEQSPVYTNWKRVRVSLGGVEPGTIVDYSYTVETIDPVMEGDFASSWVITTGGTVRRSRLILDVPGDLELPVAETNVREGRTVREVGGRKVAEWVASDLEWIEPELFPDALEADFLSRLTIGGWNSWEKIGAWYADLARDRYTIDADLVAEAEIAIGDAGSPRDRLRALYRWIAQDFRYISISLGQGGYQPRSPAEVLETRSGDCKDKATLFVALAREIGFEAYPVLLNSGGGVEESLPSVKQFNHAIAAVRLDGAWTFLDLTADIVPFGEVSPSYQGEFGVVVFDDGSIEEITFPENDPSENRMETEIRGELSEDGTFTGWYTERASGSLQYQLRSDLAVELTERELDLAADAIAAEVIQNALGDSLQVFDGYDLEAEPVVSVKVVAQRMARESGRGYLLDIPLGTFGNRALIAALEDELDSRKYPIGVAQVIGPVVRGSVFEVVLPDGWAVELPESMEIDSRFGRYVASFVHEGRTLRVERRIEGWDGTEPPEALPELIEFLDAIAEDDASYILLTPGS